MSLFQCESCGCLENTALASQGFDWKPSLWDWSYAPERKGMKLCSACGPLKFNNGTPTESTGCWHNEFDRMFLPKGEFETNQVGNLARKSDGDDNVRKYAIKIIKAPDKGDLFGDQA